MQDQVPSVGSGAGRLGRPPNPLDPATSRRAELGAEVRRLRAARGLSLDALAKLVGCSSSHLSEVENGRKLPSVGLIQSLDRVLDTAGEDGLVERFWGAVAEQTVERHDRQARRRQATEKRAAPPSGSVELQPTGLVPDADAASGASSASATLPVVEPQARGREVKSANRRTAIKAITVMGGVGALGGRHALVDAADAAVAAYRKRARVDPMTLEELDQDVERFALECLGVSHAELFPQVCDDWQQVERFLDARQGLKDRAHLTLLGGQLTYFLARLSFNMGDYPAARRHAVLAWQYAEDVGQPVLCASVRTLQGTIAFYAGQHQKALDLLRAARAYDTPYNRSRIAANTARAYAVLGNRLSAEQALAAMERHLVDLPPQPGDSPYTTATAMSALATTLACLGEGGAGEPYARRAVALHSAPGVRDALFEDRGNATLNLAASLVLRRQPEPEEAARLCIEAIAVPEFQRTETVRKRAVELRRLLGHWRTNPAVKDFADRLRGYELPAPNP
jgi:transcriptional regulator with XRE-family HTH domain/tetratricopeptide (TPR) repeat protein